MSLTPWLFPPWLLPLLVAPIIGSFVGVLIRRLPDGGKLALARSRCESCRQALGPADLVPILSFLLQRGRCRHCGAAIAPFHLWIELAAIGIVVWLACVVPAGAIWPGAILGWTLLALAWIDAERLILPDLLTLPLLLAGLTEALIDDPDRLTDRALGAALAYTGFRLIALAYRRLRGRDGLGEGDAKLLAAGGAWMGWERLGQIVLVAASAGLVLTLGLRVAGRRVAAATEIPFGPCLALGIWLVWLYAAAVFG
jgi:leader peptidase (prepilin peptidase)/N-methyltransferase